jgi:hypothetical protein
MKKMIRTIVAAAAVMSLAGCKEEVRITEAEACTPLATMFFDYTVNDAYTETTLADKTTHEDYQFLVVDLTVRNSTDSTISMSDADFWVSWGESEDEYDAPISAYGEDPVVEGELASVYEVSPAEEVRGNLVFIVPTGKDTFVLKTEDYYSTSESAEPMTGDTYSVTFSLGSDGKMIVPVTEDEKE